MELTSEAVGVSLSGKKIVEGINLHVKDGSFCALIGPNGSGKTTFLKTVYRILKADSGVIRLDGRDMNQFQSRELARQMAVVGQFNQINFTYSVMDVVLMGRTPHLSLLEREKESDRELARESLEKVGLAHCAGREYQSLSGGEKQRVILARALTQSPKLLILDEPTNHLDIRYQLEILSIIKELKISVLTALQDLNLAAGFCDYIYMLKAGHIVASGTPETVITKENIEGVYQIGCDVFKSPVDQQLMIQYHSTAQ